MNRFLLVRFAAAVMVCVALASAEDPWQTAAANGEQARRAFVACWRYTQGWLQCADPESGLIPRNLGKDFFWNAKDSAADNYPFLVMSLFYTDRGLFETRAKQMLETEQRLCNRVDRLPDDYVFATKTFATKTPNLENIIFGASEYAKDGLIPLTDLLGPSKWSERMLGLLDDIWKNGAVKTEVGVLPSDSHEVCGDLMQAMSRVYWMTGNTAYRDHVFQLADYFLVHHPPSQADELRLDDHGCEVISGLSEVYFIAAKQAPEKREQWRPEMHRVLDRVLEVARNENGLLFSLVNAKTGKVMTDDLTDNWGYNYNAFLTVAELDNEQKYRDAVSFVMKNLPKSKDYPWERDGADGYADTLEGGINLVNRMPIPEAIEWCEYTAAKLLAKQRDTGIIEGWHGDGNFARTALMYAFWKTQGAFVEPWRADIKLGAARTDDGTVYFSVQADWPWQGRIRFDIPRHDEYLHIPFDYPRINQFPEWFTVPKEGSYETSAGTLTAAQLREGVGVKIEDAKKPYRLQIKRRTGS